MGECLKAYLGEKGFDGVNWIGLVTVGPQAPFCDHAVEWDIFCENKELFYWVTDNAMGNVLI